MNIPDTVVYALIVGAVSAGGAAFGGWLSYRSASNATRNALTGVNSQIKFQHSAKIAEFRQARIIDLRDSMALLQSIGMTPELEQQQQSEFYRAGTRVELLMDRGDKDYKKLQECMYRLFNAKTTQEKYSCNQPFVEACQDILKTEWEILERDLAFATSEAQDNRTYFPKTN